MNAFLAEFVGTFFLLLLGNGVVANVLLSKTKGNHSGWVVISAAWGIAVFVGAFCSDKFSGAHLNPAVTLAMAMAGKLGLVDVIGYVVAQMLGAMAGSTVVYFHYRAHFFASDNADDKLACFCTAPNIRGNGQAFFCELVGTFTLILPIFLIPNPMIEKMPVLGLGALGLLPVGLLVFGIGLSLGGTTGHAINPARDFGPRIVHALLPIPGKRDSDWDYAWVPVLGPFAGAALAAIVYWIIGS